MLLDHAHLSVEVDGDLSKDMRRVERRPLGVAVVWLKEALLEVGLIVRRELVRRPAVIDIGWLLGQGGCGVDASLRTAYGNGASRWTVGVSGYPPADNIMTTT
ncbi:MAG TPA: hypothetical protein VFO60_10430 [Candidatus Dormibacteraeota bacterium]|nr:hypothetical protein [Candidatus Dormibacteraeota bacterium]